MTALPLAASDADETTRPPLWDHQAKGIEFALAHQGTVFDVGMGGGKSRMAIEVAERTQAAKVLVLCPKSVVGVWPREFAEHADRRYIAWSGKVQGARGPLVNPSVARRAVALIDATKLAIVTGKPLVAVVGLESCWRGDMARLLLGTEWDLVIIDEVHRIKAPGGKQSRHIARVCERVRGRGGRSMEFGLTEHHQAAGMVLGLTGTFMPHSELDVYGQLRAVDPTIFGTNNSHFKVRYAGRKIYKTGKATDCALCGGTGNDDVSAAAGEVDLPCGYCDGHGRHGDKVFEEGPNGEAVWRVGQPPRGRPLRIVRDGEPIYALGPKGEPLFDGIAEARRDEFTERLRRVVFRVSQDDLDQMIGLEDAASVIRTCELEPATRRVYEELKKDLIAGLGVDCEECSGGGCDDCDGDGATGGVITAANRMVLQTRLAQLSGGFSKDPDGNLVHVCDPPEKAKLLADALADMPADEPVVVFCRFHADFDAVRAVVEQLGRRYGELSGRSHAGLTEDSRMNPDIDVLGVHPQSGGVGVDLTRARYGIWYSLPTSLAGYEQGCKRYHRHGQARHVTHIHLIAEDTVDLAIYDALRKRRDVLKAALDAINNKENTQ